MGVPVGRAYRAMGWIAKRLAATGESVRGAVACGAGRREARHAPSVALGTSILAYGSHRRAGGRRRLRRAVLYSFRRLRIAFEAMPLPPHARSLPRHLPPARCFAQALWFDLQTPGLAD